MSLDQHWMQNQYENEMGKTELFLNKQLFVYKGFVDLPSDDIIIYMLFVCYTNFYKC